MKKWRVSVYRSTLNFLRSEYSKIHDRVITLHHYLLIGTSDNQYLVLLSWLLDVTSTGVLLGFSLHQLGVLEWTFLRAIALGVITWYVGMLYRSFGGKN